MLAVEHHQDLLTALPPTPIYHSTISLHHAKAGYDYPTIRLPYTLSKLAGLPTRVYQTLHKGALAFLVVVAPSHSASKSDIEESKNAFVDSKSVALTLRRSCVRITPGPSVFLVL